MKINIIGWYGKQNIGDDCFHSFFTSTLHEHELNFFTPPTKQEDADVTILGGGAVASPFYLNTLPKNKKLFAVGIDLAYASESDLLKNVNFEEIYIRNKNDFELLKQKMTCKVNLIPDLGFNLQPTNKDVLSKYKNSSKKTAVVLVTDYVNPAIDRSYEKFGERSWKFKIKLAKELDILHEKGYEIILLPCSTGGYGDDRRINLDIAAFMKSRPNNVMDYLDPQSMIDLLAHSDMSICQRFHAHIFSIIANTPFISIEFTKKVQNLIDSCNLEHWTGVKLIKDTDFNFDDFENLSSSFNVEDRKNLKIISNKNHELIESFKKQFLLSLSE